MDKRHLLDKMKAVKLHYVLAAFLLLTAVTIIALRQNNVHMLKLKQAVYAADKNDGDTQKALQNLQQYVTAHMNTNLSAGPNASYPPIQLKYTYERLLQAQTAEAAKNNTELYSQAQAYCEQQNPTDFSGRNRVPCIADYVQAHGVTAAPTTSIPASQYQFSFVSPAWSPDLAGWSLLAAILAGGLSLLLIGLRLLARPRKA